ncbi:MAG: lipopolysaccharide assembly protein LapB [Proteobacteria bacterium]|nr:lipopolysaccharide assembly protein LapB [Burkholderiales bacterium]
MEFEYWYLIAFPIFFGLGWLAARIDIQQLVTESRALPVSYFRGINFLVNEQQDKAIEAFIEVVKVDPQTIELHFALGSLFRRRGEVERAIRMHQSLVDREDLGNDRRLDAIYELAQDYLKAGLLDRAEELFKKLEGTAREDVASQALLEIYEQEREWERAIDTARRAESRDGRSFQMDIANYYCELAANELAHARPNEARERLELALASHRKSVRASILLGDIEFATGQVEAAIDAWKRIESQNPAYLSMVAEKLLNAYRMLGKPEVGLRLLQYYLDNHPSLDLMTVVFEATLEQQGAEDAYRLVRDELKRSPTLIGLTKLLEAQLVTTPVEQRNDLELIKNLVQQQTHNLAMYRCDQCGFKARQFYWHCPACGGWETYSPKRTEERVSGP